MARGSIGAWRRLRKRPLCMRRGLLAGEGGAGRMIGWEGFWLKLVGRNGQPSVAPDSSSAPFIVLRSADTP